MATLDVPTMTDALSWHRPPAEQASSGVLKHSARKHYPRSRLGRMEAQMLAVQANMTFLLIVLSHSEWRPRYADVAAEIGTSTQNARIRLKKLLERCGWDLRGTTVTRQVLEDPIQEQTYPRTGSPKSTIPPAESNPSVPTGPYATTRQWAVPVLPLTNIPSAMSVPPEMTLSSANTPPTTTPAPSVAAFSTAKRKLGMTDLTHKQDARPSNPEADAPEFENFITQAPSTPEKRIIAALEGTINTSSDVRKRQQLFKTSRPVKYSAIPCVHCRHRAVRCSKALPTCSNCVQKKLDCVYQMELPKRVPRTSSGGRDLPCCNCRRLKKLCNKSWPCGSCVNKSLPCLSFEGRSSDSISERQHKISCNFSEDLDDYHVGQQGPGVLDDNNIEKVAMSSSVHPTHDRVSYENVPNPKKFKLEVKSHDSEQPFPDTYPVSKPQRTPLAPDVAHVDDWSSTSSSEDDAARGEHNGYFDGDEGDLNGDEGDEGNVYSREGEVNRAEEKFESNESSHDEDAENVSEEEDDDDDDDDDDADPVALKVRLAREYERWQLK